MNLARKIILYSLNTVMLILSVTWYLKTKDTEPVIVFCGQIIAIITLAWDSKSTVIRNRGIDNSGINIKSAPGDNIRNRNVKGSTIDIDNK